MTLVPLSSFHGWCKEAPKESPRDASLIPFGHGSEEPPDLNKDCCVRDHGPAEARLAQVNRFFGKVDIDNIYEILKDRDAALKACGKQPPATGF